MRHLKFNYLLPFFAVTLLLSGCDSNDGPAERAGAKMDKTVENIKESFEPEKGPMEKAGENMDKAMDNSAEKMKEMADKVEEKTNP